MADVSDAARQFMAVYFAMGRKSSLKSHEPHSVLSKASGAFNECKASGLVTVEPFNNHGSIIIRATDEGYQIAREAFEESARRLFGTKEGADVA